MKTSRSISDQQKLWYNPHWHAGSYHSRAQQHSSSWQPFLGRANASALCQSHCWRTVHVQRIPAPGKPLLSCAQFLFQQTPSPIQTCFFYCCYFTCPNQLPINDVAGLNNSLHGLLWNKTLEVHAQHSTPEGAWVVLRSLYYSDYSPASALIYIYAKPFDLHSRKPLLYRAQSQR